MRADFFGATLLSVVMVILATPPSLASREVGRATDLRHSLCDPKTSELERELSRIDCDFRKLALSLLAQEEVAPSRIYHYGMRKHLQEDIRERNVPQAIWSQFIRGGAPTIKQSPFRQGFYGGSNPAEIANYASNPESWLIEIEIRPECRKPARVATLVGLTKDQRFQEWYSQAHGLPLDLKEFVKRCYSEGPQGAPTDVKTIDGNDRPATDCERVLDRFLEDNEIKLVQDDLVERSWYIRDRSCIGTIRGTPDELVSIMTENSGFWIHLCSNEISAGPLMRILAQAIADAEKPISPQSLSKLKANLESADSIRFEGKGKVLALVNAYERCAKSGSLLKYEKALAELVTPFQMLSDRIETEAKNLCITSPSL